MKSLLPEMAERLSDTDLGKLAAYLNLVDEYTSASNLTGYSGATDLARGLVGESLRLQELKLILPGHKVIDLGSGNGSPVVPLAVVYPEAEFVAVESRMKRGAFLGRVKAVLQLTNLSVRVERTEATAQLFPNHFDIATSRGFAKPQIYFEMASAFLKPAGTVIGYCGETTEADEDRPQRTPRSFAASYRALRKDFGGWALVAVTLFAFAIALWAVFDLATARADYLRMTIFHGHLELAALALWWMGASRPEARSVPMAFARRERKCARAAFS